MNYTGSKLNWQGSRAYFAKSSQEAGTNSREGLDGNGTNCCRYTCKPRRLEGWREVYFPFREPVGHNRPGTRKCLVDRHRVSIASWRGIRD